MKVIGITGGTGLVGSHITQLLASKGYEVVILTRNTKDKQPHNNISYALWNNEHSQCDTAAISRLDAVIPIGH